MSIKKGIIRGVEYILKGVPQINVSVTVSQVECDKLLKDKIAIITGGAGGIGKAIATKLLLSGATVIITGRDENRLIEVINSINKTRSTQNLFPLILNNKDITSFKEKIDFVYNRFGKIDILVNNAGVIGGDITTCEEDEFDNIINTNLRSAFFLSKEVGELMKKGNIRGNILNISSSSSIRPANSAYALSKWGLRGLTLGLAKLLIPYGIVVNAIAPGPTATSMLNIHENSNLYFPNPLGRYIKPEEIAEMAAFLVSNMGRSIVGDTIFMTGGSGLITMDDIKYRF